MLRRLPKTQNRDIIQPLAVHSDREDPVSNPSSETNITAETSSSRQVENRDFWDPMLGLSAAELEEWERIGMI